MVVAKEPFAPGEECPDCGEELRKPTGGHWDHEPRPHDDPKACIRYLRNQLDRAMRALENHNLL